jgi:hypothetical protein
MSASAAEPMLGHDHGPKTGVKNTGDNHYRNGLPAIVEGMHARHDGVHGNQQADRYHEHTDNKRNSIWRGCHLSDPSRNRKGFSFFSFSDAHWYERFSVVSTRGPWVRRGRSLAQSSHQ